MENKTTISITQDLWKYLNDNRTISTDTIEDVIWRFIKEENGNQNI